MCIGTCDCAKTICFNHNLQIFYIVFNLFVFFVIMFVVFVVEKELTTKDAKVDAKSTKDLFFQILYSCHQLR